MKRATLQRMQHELQRTTKLTNKTVGRHLARRVLYLRASQQFITGGCLKEFDMTSYLLVSSCSPAHQSNAEQIYAVAAELCEAGNDVTLLLIENGVLCARGGPSTALRDLHVRGVKVIADEASLASRGLAPTRLASGIQVARISTVVERVESQRQAELH